MPAQSADSGKKVKIGACRRQGPGLAVETPERPHCNRWRTPAAQADPRHGDGAHGSGTPSRPTGGAAAALSWAFSRPRIPTTGEADWQQPAAGNGRLGQCGPLSASFKPRISSPAPAPDHQGQHTGTAPSAFEAAPLVVGQPAPDPRVRTGVHGPSQAGVNDLAAAADGLCLLDLDKRRPGVSDREEQLGVLTQARRTTGGWQASALAAAT
jgi:hypothetical protein